MQYLESGIYIACSRLQDSGEEAHREKLHENCGVGGGGGMTLERWVIGACKNCFQYIIPVYQLLVHHVIGQFWQFMSTMSTESLRFNVAAAKRSTTTTSQVHHILWHISLPFLHDYDVKMPNFVFCGERKQATTKFYFSFWIGIGSLGIQLQEGSPTFDNVSGEE